MKVTEFSVKKPVTIFMVFLAVLLIGVVSFSRLAVDLFPNFNLPIAAVITSYSGAGPEEVENMVTKPLEESLGTVQRVDNISSYSSFGSSIVLVEFTNGTDMDFASLNMREKIDLVKGYLPSDAGDPMVMTMDPSMMPVMVIGFAAGQYDLDQLKEIAEDTVQPRIERQEGVASVDIIGGYDREIHVVLDPVKMDAYGLSASTVAQYLQADNVNLSVSTVQDGDKEYSVRAVGQYASLDDIRNTNIMLSGGNSILLSDIAQVTEGHAKVSSIARINGEPAIALSISKQSDANLTAVAGNIEKEMTKIQADLPDNITLVPIMNQADYINMVIDTLVSNLVIGAILAILVLLVFLRNGRSTLIIAISIPLSLIATFALIYFSGMTLNLMTLGGLALGVGMMVDASIVILEGIVRKQEEGMGRIQAAISGAGELANAVVASALTTIAVFLPIVFTSGVVSSLFKDLAFTVSFSLIVSLVVALTLVPMMASKILKVEQGEKKNGWYQKLDHKVGNFLAAMDEKYRKLLHWALDHRKKVIIGVTIMLVASLLLFPVVGMEFLPASDSGQLSITITMENGTPLEETDRVVTIVENHLADLGADVDIIYSSIGGGGSMMSMGGAGSESASITVMLVGKEDRKKGIAQIADELRQELQGIPAAEISVAATDATGMSALSGGAALSIEIKGDDMTILRNLSDEVQDIVASVEGTREVDSSLDDTKEQMEISINRNKASQYGLTLPQITSAVRAAFEGQIATTYKSGGSEVDVRLIYPEEYRKNLTDMKNLTIMAPTGMKVSLDQIAAFTVNASPVTIQRDNQSRIVNVTSQIYGRDLNSVSQDVQAKLNAMVLPAGYSVSMGGSVQEMMDAFSDLSFALILAILLVYMVMASLFESLTYPFIIMFSMPTAFIGIILSLLLTGRTINVSSFIGIIMLAGIVVNNAIVLVDNINRLRKEEGMERRAAIEKAGPQRLRPILMTTLTTILAMFPLALGLGEGAELSAPMGTVVFGGLTVSSIFTLVLVPVVYTIVDDLGKKLRNKARRKPKGAIQE